MRHLTDDTNVLGDYVAKPGDYGYFDWDRVDRDYAKLITPIEIAAPGVKQTVKLALAAPLLVGFTLWHSETGQLFRVWERIDDETYVLHLLPWSKATVALAAETRLKVHRVLFV